MTVLAIQIIQELPTTFLFFVFAAKDHGAGDVWRAIGAVLGVAALLCGAVVLGATMLSSRISRHEELIERILADEGLRRHEAHEARPERPV